MIQQQQEELRRVSEQLMMARYGVVSPVVNVSLPFANENNACESRFVTNNEQNIQSENATHHIQSHQSSRIQQADPNTINMSTDTDYVRLEAEQQHMQVINGSGNDILSFHMNQSPQRMFSTGNISSTNENDGQ